MMHRSSHSPIWPFLLVVGFLFLLCLLAPREWERIAHRQPSRVVSTFRGQSEASLTPLYEREQDSSDTLATAEKPLAEDASALLVSTMPAATAVSSPEPASIVTPSVVEIGAAVQNAPEPSTLAQPESTEVVEIAVDPEPEPSAEPATTPPVQPIFNALRGESADSSAASETEPSPAEVARPAVPAATLVAQVAEKPQRKEAPPEARQQPGWAMPEDLIRRLETLACECDCTEWSLRVEQLVLELCDQTAPTDARAGELLAQLRAAATEVDARIPQISERSVAIELLRVRHGLVRRLDVWELMPAAFSQQISAAGPSAADIKRLSAALDRLDSITSAGGAEGTQWRRYLELDALRTFVDAANRPAAANSRKLSREVQSRLARHDLSDGQRQFIASAAVTELAGALRSWSLEPFEPARLLADLEQFEATNQPSDARRVAEDYLESVSLVLHGADLARRLEANYRNANVRLALSEKLLKRLLPGASWTTDPVRDQILGHPTRGTSTTSTTVDVKLVPDSQHLRVALEASGQVYANTRSMTGPATLHTQSNSMYLARKVVDLDLRGIRTWPAESECLDTRTQLRSISTDFDGVPLVGALVENFARSRHADQEDEVRTIIRRRVESQARRKMDSVTEERLDRVNQLLQKRVLQPLDRMALNPQVISAETSEQRLTMRLRVAGEEQLASNTPRPRAPGDSLMSLQIHQSLFNNICEQLQLSGRTFTLPELRDHIVKALNLENSRFMDATDQDVTITFAEQDAIRVFCEHGRLELDLAVARLSNAERTWKNFQVRVFYRPEVEGLQARLVRDGTVQLIGSRLAAQIPLRGIFSKAFAKDRDLELVDPKWSSDERTRELAFSQFVIQDGWIAVAVSEPPQNLANKPHAPKSK